MYSAWDDPVLPGPGCPIRIPPDQCLLSGSPKLFAACHALLRLLAPRHSPYALSSLTIFANATQRKLQFVTRIQLSKNKRSPHPNPLPEGEGSEGTATNLRKISER